MGRAVRVGGVLGFVVDSTLIDCFLFLGILLSYSDIWMSIKIQAKHHVYDTLLPTMFGLYSCRCQWLTILSCFMVSFVQFSAS